MSCSSASETQLDASGAQPPVDINELANDFVVKERISPEEARCLAEEVSQAFSIEEIEIIRESGIIALPSPKWGLYVYAAVECVIGQSSP